jgi:hypothetical protein
MTFTTLEARFKATADTLYKRYENKQQLEVIRPNSSASRLPIKNDSRLAPIISTSRDLKLMGKFLSSLDKGGPQFLATQLFLQTGNTFAETRKYNPLGVLIHTIPFVHKPRNLPLSPIRDRRGALQQETINNFGITGASRLILSFSGFYSRPEDNYFYNINNSGIYEPLLPDRQPVSQRGQKKAIKFISLRTNDSRPRPIDVGFYGRWDVNRTLGFFRENSQYVTELLSKNTSQKYFQLKNKPNPNSADTNFLGTTLTYTYLEKISKRNENNIRVGSVFNLGKDFNQVKFLTADSRSPKFKESFTKYNTQTIPSRNTTFRSLTTASATLNGYFSGSNLTPASSPDQSTPSGSTRLQDPINLGRSGTTGLYKNITGELQNTNIPNSDIIPFVFKLIDRVGNSEAVQFRALISSIKENIKPEYNETRYVGRTERFVTYAGAKRSVTLDFNVVAFSKNELTNVWTRINYLTGLAFPRKVSESGFMAPPLFKLTIGGIYDSQPCYVESLDFTMLDETITFDIDHKVPQRISVNMTISLLEKRSRYYDSPFYEIVQNMSTTNQRSTPQ